MKKREKCNHIIGVNFSHYSILPVLFRLDTLTFTLEKLHNIDKERHEDGQLYRDVRQPFDFLSDLSGYGKWFK